MTRVRGRKLFHGTAVRWSRRGLRGPRRFMARCAAAVLLLTMPGVEALWAQSDAISRALSSLVEAERAFARLSVAQGVRAAFLANLGDDAVIFRPAPVAGRPVFESSPASPAFLDWGPVFAEVSWSGDLGYTTGPFVLRPGGRADTTAIYGHYVTLWKRATRGPWKVALDIGVSHAKPPEAGLETRRPDGAPASAAGALASLLRADSSLGGGGGTAGAVLGARLADDARLYREGTLPVVGAAASRAALAAEGRAYRVRPAGGGTATSGDLGFTYGAYTLVAAGEDRSGDAEGYYLRIWRRSAVGPWRVVLDLASP